MLWAVSENNTPTALKLVGLLLDHSADINKQGGENGCALVAAIITCNLHVVSFLLEHGADVNVCGGRWGCPLRAASARGDIMIVELLLQHKPDVNSRQWALGPAIARGYKTIVDLLLEHGADGTQALKDADDLILMAISIKSSLIRGSVEQPRKV